MKKKLIKNFWSLNVDEVLVANWLKEKLEGCEVFFPVNFQFPYVDLIVYNPKNKKTVTIQVKSSQIYLEKYKKLDYWTTGQDFSLKKVKSNKVDFFIFTGYYPIYSENVKNKTLSRNIENYFVVFDTKELEEYIEKYKTVKIQKQKRIGFGFYIWLPDTRKEEGELCDDWYIKPKYEDDVKRYTILSKALENWKLIKTKL